MFRKTSGAFCLILALTIIFSSFGIGAAAFTDEELISYKTAVGVMHGAGILGGYTDGSFNPTGSITREEAAKLIAFAVLGENRVKELPRGQSSFSDLPGDRWSAPYVAWAAENGIISGLGDGSFNPGGKVTGYQLAKMMLCAAGYGQKGEYSGASWERRAAADGFAKGIFTGISNADPSSSVTREEAALYIFNSITRIEQVVYKEAQGKYVPADGTEKADNTIAAVVYGILDFDNTSTVYRGILKESAATGASETVVGDVSLNHTAGLELVGRYVSVYTNGADNLKMRVYYIADESETVRIENDILESRQFKDTFGASLSVSDELLVYDTNGTLTTEKSIPGFSAVEHKAPAGSYVFYEGKLISYMPVISEFAAQIEKLSFDEVTINGESYKKQDVISLVGYAEGDIVLARPSGGRISIKHVQTYEGVLEKLKKDPGGKLLATVDGRIFAQSDIENTTKLPSASNGIGSACTVYFDSNYKFFAIESR